MEQKLNKKLIPPFQEEFKAWAISNNSISKDTVNIYISNIRTAFDNFRYTYKDLFNLIENTFKPIFQIPKNLSHDKLEIWNIENILELFEEYIEDLSSLKDGIAIFDEKTEEWKIAVVQNWVQALRSYKFFLETEFICFKHEVLKDSNLPLSQPFKIPFKKEFAKYLAELKYSKTSKWTYISRFNKCLSGIFNKYHFKEFMDKIPTLIKSQEHVPEIEAEFNAMKKIMETEIELRDSIQFINDLHEPWITKQDLQDGLNILDKYERFIKYIMKEPTEYVEV